MSRRNTGIINPRWAKGMAFCTSPDFTYDIINPGSKQTISDPNTHQVVPAAPGLVLSSTEQTGDYTSYDHVTAHDAPTDELTLLVYCKPNVSSAVGTAGLMVRDGASNDSWYLRWMNNGVIRVAIYHTGPGVYAANSTTAIPTDRWSLVGATYKNGGDLRMRVNRAYNDDADAHTNGIVQTTHPPHLGGMSLGAGASFDGQIAYGAFFSRELSNAEWEHLVDNPFDLFQDTSRIFIPTRTSATPVAPGVVPRRV